MRSLLFACLLAASHQRSLGAHYQVTLLRPPTGADYTGFGLGGVSGGMFAGGGRLPIEQGQLERALLWDGVAANVVSLHPAGFEESGATDMFAMTQVGYGVNRRTATTFHALKWAGTADSVVDLHPTGYAWSSASAVSGDYQVGSGPPIAPGGGSAYQHALLWNGTADSVVDLHPSRFDFSAATDVAGAVQVG